jgi:hypothetical protein
VNFTDQSLAERSTSLVERIRANLPFLGKVRGQKFAIENVVDMVENARRRIVDQARYDDGVARLYRLGGDVAPMALVGIPLDPHRATWTGTSRTTR